MITLVTGSNRGLGLELVREGLQRGHTVIATFRTAGPDLPALAAQHEGRLVLQEMDVADYASCVTAREALAARFPGIDCVINNAAVLFESKAFKGDPIVDLDLETFYRTVEVNTYGPIHVLKAFMPLVYKGQDRCLVNITTEGVKMRSEGSHYIAYACSKSAMQMYSQKIRNYLAAREDTKDIRVFMVHPGRMFTIMGVENAQIQPSEPAFGIWDIIERKVDIHLDLPFVNYKGEPMPYL